MTFSEAQFQAAVGKINNGMTDLSANGARSRSFLP